MQRSFCDPVTGDVKSRLGNVYFHLNLNCVSTEGNSLILWSKWQQYQAMSLNTLGQSIYIYSKYIFEEHCIKFSDDVINFYT